MSFNSDPGTSNIDFSVTIWAPHGLVMGAICPSAAWTVRVFHDATSEAHVQSCSAHLGLICALLWVMIGPWWAQSLYVQNWASNRNSVGCYVD